MAAAMQEERKDMRAFAMLGLVMLLWAGNSIIARAVRFDIPPLTLAFARWAVAAAVLAPFAARGVWRDRRAILGGWKPLLVLGLLGVGSFNAFLYVGLQHTTATNALLLQAGIPPLVVLLDLALFRTRPDGWQAVGLVCSILGVIAIVFEGDPAAALRLHFGFGDAMVLVAVSAWSLYTVLLRLRPAIAPLSFLAVTFAIGALAMAPFAFAEWQARLRVNWTPAVLGALCYVALLAALASYFIYNWAAARLGPARAGQAITLLPLFGALLSAALLGERLHGYHFAGMGLILAGIVLGAAAMRGKVSAGAAQAPSLEG